MLTSGLIHIDTRTPRSIVKSRRDVRLGMHRAINILKRTKWVKSFKVINWGDSETDSLACGSIRVRFGDGRQGPLLIYSKDAKASIEYLKSLYDSRN